MLTLVKKNTAFFIPYLIFLLAGGAILILWNKENIHLFINSYHSPGFNFFFIYWTDIGLGWSIIPVIIFFAFIRLRYVIVSLAGFLITFIINDSIKVMVGAARPSAVFEKLHEAIYHVPGVELYATNSFPSGHTAIAFALFCILALATNYNSIKLLCFLVAFLVAYSRMYLSEHFLVDVYAASFIGTTCALVTFNIGLNWKWLNKFPAMDKPLINLRRV